MNMLLLLDIPTYRFLDIEPHLFWIELNLLSMKLAALVLDEQMLSTIDLSYLAVHSFARHLRIHIKSWILIGSQALAAVDIQSKLDVPVFTHQDLD